MIDELLKQWAERQKSTGGISTVGSVQEKCNAEIHIAQQLQRAGYTGELNGFPLDFIISDRQRLLREMHQRVASF